MIKVLQKSKSQAWMIILAVFINSVVNTQLALARSYQCKKLFYQKSASLSSMDLQDKLTNQQIDWSSDHFSNPTTHNPNQFVYIVHDIFGFNLDSASKMIWGKNKDSAQINIIKNPDKISELAVISTSIVTANHVKTYGAGWGVILKVPSSNFMAATPVDMQSSKLREALPLGEQAVARQVQLLNKKHGLPPRQTIIEATPKDRHNELLVLGTGPSGEKVEVVGFYLVNKGRYNNLQAQDLLLGTTGTANSQMNQLIQIANEHHLPIVILEATN